jgi:hypothetical protein
VTRPRVAIGFLLPLVVAACGGGGDPSGGATTGAGGSTTSTVADTSGTDRPTTSAVAEVAPSAREDVPSALENPDDPSFPPALVDVDEIISGGPPPDGIPAIDEPKFLSPDEVTFLEDVEPVIAFELDGEARAYPLQILTWHEIVNDTVAGVPVAVTYCPLCNTAVVFDRRLGERVLDFGTSGKLYQSALVMYDRQTESLWSHFTSQSLAGFLAGDELATYPAAIVSWASWKAAHPDGLVLGRDTGHARDYGINPYPGYDDVDSPPFLFEGEVDGRLAAKERIVGVGLDTEPVAVLLEPLAASGVIEVTVDERPVVLFHLPGTASALESGEVAGGRDVGAVGVFDPVVDGQTLTFTRGGDGFVDDQTGSRWDIFGTAVGGPLTGKRLEPVEHVDTFWFAWAAYQPDTHIEP